MSEAVKRLELTEEERAVLVVALANCERYYVALSRCATKIGWDQKYQESQQAADVTRRVLDRLKTPDDPNAQRCNSPLLQQEAASAVQQRGGGRMSKIHAHMTVRFFTTSSQLRKIASDIEGKYSTSRPGDDLTVATIGGKDCDIEFIIDQEAMGKERVKQAGKKLM